MELFVKCTQTESRHIVRLTNPPAVCWLGKYHMSMGPEVKQVGIVNETIFKRNMFEIYLRIIHDNVDNTIGSDASEPSMMHSSTYQKFA